MTPDDFFALAKKNEAEMVDLKFVPSQRLLVAATHGLGIFYLQLPQ